MNVAITLYANEPGPTSGYIICSLIGTSIAPGNGNPGAFSQSQVLASQSEALPIASNTTFTFSSVPAAAGYYIEIILSPTTNRADGVVASTTGWNPSVLPNSTIGSNVPQSNPSPPPTDYYAPAGAFSAAITY